MALLRIRLTGDEDAVRGIMNLLQSIDGIEHVEEVADLMPHLPQGTDHAALVARMNRLAAEAEPVPAADLIPLFTGFDASSAAIASVNWISPPAPGCIASSRSKMRGLST